MGKLDPSDTFVATVTGPPSHAGWVGDYVLKPAIQAAVVVWLSFAMAASLAAMAAVNPPKRLALSATPFIVRGRTPRVMCPSEGERIAPWPTDRLRGNPRMDSEIRPHT